MNGAQPEINAAVEPPQSPDGARPCTASGLPEIEVARANACSVAATDASSDYKEQRGEHVSLSPQRHRRRWPSTVRRSNVGPTQCVFSNLALTRLTKRPKASPAVAWHTMSVCGPSPASFQLRTLAVHKAHAAARRVRKRKEKSFGEQEHRIPRTWPVTPRSVARMAHFGTGTPCPCKGIAQCKRFATRGGGLLCNPLLLPGR